MSLEKHSGHKLEIIFITVQVFNLVFLRTVFSMTLDLVFNSVFLRMDGGTEEKTGAIIMTSIDSTDSLLGSIKYISTIFSKIISDTLKIYY